MSLKTVTIKDLKPITKSDKILHEFINQDQCSITHNTAIDGLRSRKIERQLKEDHIESERYD